MVEGEITKAIQEVSLYLGAPSICTSADQSVGGGPAAG